MLKLFPFAITSLLIAASPSARAYKFVTLYHFTNKADGGQPVGGVVQDSSGTIYGETFQGGSTICPNPPYTRQGCGTVYSFSETGGFKLLASFTGANGGHGNITPVLVGNTLYGATQAGGANNQGVIFSVNTNGTNFTLLHQFAGTDGTDPDALVADSSGTLYGITQTGGTNNNGVLFSLTPTGIFTILHEFAFPISGYPNALIIAPDGTIVGSTSYGGKKSLACLYGCGTIFEYAQPARSFLTLGTFPSSGVQGNSPYVGSFGPGPTIYAASLNTSLFALSHQSGFVTLADENSYTTGSGASSGPIYTKSGILYGVLAGSIEAGAGVVYSLQNGVLTDIHVFSGLYAGAGPLSKPIVSTTNTLIGTAAGAGNCNYCGTIWELTP